VRRGSQLLDIQGPDLLVALVGGAGYEVGEKERQSLLRLGFGLAALEDACRRRGAALERVLAWCWTTWGTGATYGPPTEWARRSYDRVPSEDLKRIWQAAPAAAFSDRLWERLGDLPEVWPYLTEEAWARWLEVWAAEHRRYPEGAEAFRFVPEKLVLQAVRDGSVMSWGHDIHRVLWARMPGKLLELVDELAESPPQPHSRGPGHGGPITELAYSAPGEHCRSLVMRARTWVAAPSRYPGVGEWLRGWLVRVVEQRADGWREAYGLLLDTGEQAAP